ncbi:MAG: hypothetical protein JWP83_1465 [Mycobacterium sp.]|jgi:hypothetical protein|nr:hypothetical protein [Mycobacterium sp.]
MVNGAGAGRGKMEDAAGGSHVRDDDAGAVGVARMVGQRTGGMESTGLFWKLIYFLLEDVVECWQTSVAGTSCRRQH